MDTHKYRRIDPYPHSTIVCIVVSLAIFLGNVPRRILACSGNLVAAHGAVGGSDDPPVH